MTTLDCFRAASLVNIVVHLLLIVSLYSAAASLSEDLFGPTDPTGQIDFSDGTACACPGSPVQYLCTVSDPSGQTTGTTLWRGTAFDCTGNQAGLFHNQYTAGLAATACDNGNFNLSARGLTNVTGNCYTSVLTVNIEPGLNGRTVECTFAGTRTIGNDTLRVAVPLPPPSTPQVDPVIPDQSFTVSWAPPTAECGNAVTYMYPGQPASMCGQCTGRSATPSVTCSGWTAQGQNCSFTVRGDTDNFTCGGQLGGESQPVVIRLPRPTAPSITGGEVAFDQSRGTANITVEWEPVAPTAAIAESGGDVLLNGTIRDYLVTFIGDPVIVNCTSATCTSSAIDRLTDGTNLFIGVAARNAITQGEAGQALCSKFHVDRSTGSSVLDVTLTCPVAAGCTIRYGLDPTYQTLPFEGRSGEPLQNLTAGETYYTEATFTCGGLTVRVQYTFDTCECSSSGLFAGAVTEAATCPQEFTGGVRTSSSNGFACYSGLTADSTAVFMCDVDGANANCTGSCEAVCMCSVGGTGGEWSASFEAIVCLIPTSGLGSGEVAGICIAAVAVVVPPAVGVVLLLVVLVYYCWGIVSARQGNKGSHGPSFRESEKEPMNWRRVAIIGCVLLVPVFGVVAAVVLAVYFRRRSRKVSSKGKVPCHDEDQSVGLHETVPSPVSGTHSAAEVDTNTDQQQPDEPKVKLTLESPTQMHSPQDLVYAQVRPTSGRRQVPPPAEDSAVQYSQVQVQPTTA